MLATDSQSEQVQVKGINPIELRLQGLTYAEIGKVMGISRQRAQQLVRPTKQVYDYVRARANNACEGCGISLRSGHVHHKTLPDLEGFNDLDNLEYLCVSCHRMRHMDAEPGEPREEICKRCSHVWNTSRKQKSVVCPKCKSPYWDRPRQVEPPKAELTA